MRLLESNLPELYCPQRKVTVKGSVKIRPMSEDDRAIATRIAAKRFTPGAGTDDAGVAASIASKRLLPGECEGEVRHPAIIDTPIIDLIDGKVVRPPQEGGTT